MHSLREVQAPKIIIANNVPDSLRIRLAAVSSPNLKGIMMIEVTNIKQSVNKNTFSPTLHFEVDVDLEIVQDESAYTDEEIAAIVGRSIVSQLKKNSNRKTAE